MEITTKSREELKARFAKNVVLTEAEFSELVEAGLVPADDLAVRAAGEPFSVEAGIAPEDVDPNLGPTSISKNAELLRFYESFDDAEPAWRIHAHRLPGLDIQDGGGNSRLFLLHDGSTTGAGLGTISASTYFTLRAAPQNGTVGITQEQVGGAYTMELVTRDSSAASLPTRLLLRGGQGTNNNIELYRGARGSETASIFIHGQTGNVGLGTGTATPLGRLQVGGAIVAQKGESESSGIRFLHDASGADQDQGWLLYTHRGGERTTLEIGTSDETEDHVAFMPSGHVGVKTTDPDAPLHVASGDDVSLSRHGHLLLGTAAGKNLVLGDDGLMARDNGAAAPLSLQGLGGNLAIQGVASGRKVGLGTASLLQTLDVNGRLHVADGVIQRGGDAITDTSDLGLYSQVNGNWIRLVTNGGPFRFYTDGGSGTDERLSLEAGGNLIVHGGRLGVATDHPGAAVCALGAVRGASSTAESEHTELGHDGGDGYVDTAGDGRLDLRRDGTTLLSVTAGGDVGIGTGTVDPAARLQVKGGAIMPAAGSTADHGIRFPGDPWGGWGDVAWIRWYARSGEDTTLEIGNGDEAGGGDGDDHIALMAAGHVGIGTNAPQTDLSVIGKVRAAADTTEAEYVQFGQGGSHGYVDTTGDGRLDVRHGGSTQLSIFADGKVGLGTTTPDVELSVIGAVRAAHDTSEVDTLEFGHGGSHGYLNKRGNGNLQFRHDGVTRMILTAAGGVALGPDSLASGVRLHVSGGTAILDPEGWRTATLQNNWVNFSASTNTTGYNPTGYFKDSCGVVHLRGLVKSGSLGAAIFTLPSGFRPPKRELFRTISAAGVARVDVYTNGQVYAHPANTTNAWLSLDRLSFRAV